MNESSVFEYIEYTQTYRYKNAKIHALLEGLLLGKQKMLTDRQTDKKTCFFFIIQIDNNHINNRYLFPDCIKIIFIRTEIKFRTYFTIKVYQIKL